MAMMVMEVAMTAMYAVRCVLVGGFVLVIPISLFLSICCGESAQERAAAERRAALAEMRSTAAMPAPVEVEVEVAAAPVVAKLGYFPYTAEGRKASEKLVCAICLEVFQHGEKCNEVPACQHLFHRDCIGVWMKTNTTCPLCRRQIMPGSDRLLAAEEMV